MGVYGPHTQFKCLLEAMIFGTCKKNIIMYSQMRFLHQKTDTKVQQDFKGQGHSDKVKGQIKVTP